MTDGSTKRRVLLTGANGRIGKAFATEMGDRYKFRLTVRDLDRLDAKLRERHETITLDVSNLDACRATCEGIDTVVHMAADPSPEADFYGSLLENNIKGTFNIFQAAEDAGCQRVIFASSVHAVYGYPPQAQPRTDDPVRPANMYGVTKVFGEGVASRFALRGLSSIAVRIGAYHANWIEKDPSPEALKMYVSARDLNQLLVKCIETEGIDYAIVHGVSNNRYLRLDLSSTRALLGYEPVDDGFEVFRL